MRAIVIEEHKGVRDKIVNALAAAGISTLEQTSYSGYEFSRRYHCVVLNGNDEAGQRRLIRQLIKRIPVLLLSSQSPPREFLTEMADLPFIWSEWPEDDREIGKLVTQTVQKRTGGST